MEQLPVRVLAYALAAAFLLVWAAIDFVRLSRTRQVAVEEDDGDHVTASKRRRPRSALVATTVSCAALISSFYVGFCVYTVLDTRGGDSTTPPPPLIPETAVFSAATWVFFSLLALLCGKKVVRGPTSRWPPSLRFWWAAFGLYDAFTVGVFLTRTYLGGLTLPEWFPPATLFPDVAAFPLVALLGVSVFLLDCHGKRGGGGEAGGLEQPFLNKEPRSASAGFSGAGIWSKLVFMWLNPVFEMGRREKLELNHIPSVPKSETAEHSHFTLQEALLRRPKARGSSLVRAIARSEWKHLSVNAVFAGINTLSSYTGPLLITSFVEFLSGKDPGTGTSFGYVLAALFFLSKTVESLSQRQWYFGSRRIGMRVRAALMVAIYNKSLSIKYSTTGTGKIINLLDVDVERIGDFSWYFHSIWLLPVQVSLALLILYWNLGGLPSVAALLATVLVMISNIPLANLQERLHSRIMEAKDARMKATTECLKCIRILKLHSWENVYLQRLLRLRDAERGWLKRYLYTCSAVAFLFWASPTLVSVITFGVCILSKTPLTPGAVLSALATFRILQDPIYNLPELVSMIAQTKVSIDRVQDFIRDDDQRKSSPENFKPETSHGNAAVEIEPGEYAWETSQGPQRNATIQIHNKIRIMKGEKVAVCGLVGSGKSSFLYSIIGEIPRTSGMAIKVFGSTAYVPQTAWIQTGTIRDNILFGKEMDKGFYDEVVQGCALTRDFEIWADGDMTIVGERGINLSGGQKQRVQLARAIYSNSDVYLLDDPFSAVDAHTAGHLYKECLQRLLSSKTVIYATHQLEFLDSSDLILVMRDGEIVQSGKYHDLVSDVNGEFVRQLTAHKESVNQVSPTKLQGAPLKASQAKEPEVIEEKHVRSTMCEYTIETESGRVKWEVYASFITTAFGGALVPIILLCQVLFQGLQIGSNYWIAWGTEEDRRMSRERLIGVFVCLSIGSSVFVLGRAVLLATVAVETAQRLFEKMITCIFRAPISFFDHTPSSRILNRSSTDQSILDTDIPYRVGGLVFALVQLLGIVILMSLIAWPVLILFIIILALSFWYQAYYISTARELARMVSIRKSPILHHLSESILGSATIRCFKQERRFTSKNLLLIDDYSRVSFHNSATMEWLSVRTNFLFNLIFFAVLIILVIVPKATINPSLAGLATTYGLNLNVLQAWIIWNLCNVENKMISVERIMQFTNLPNEAPLVIEHCRPEPNWPTTGIIEFKDLHVAYGPGLPMVLRGITCTFPGQMKIGVVGRTGSGKSTLIQALFRVVEPSIGRILIDGKDICQIGLYDLRSRLSIIPQDPSLFHGTLRTNLDPLQQHEDFEIWEALQKCHLEEIVTQDPRLLDTPVAEDGENWSVGQRQLVCLARELLKKKKILVLDEATASVDTATDNMIQRTIREETNSCTVISIAHRIPTVIDNDRVLVLDEGKILEYDSPKELLKDENSAFSRLVVDFLRHSEKFDGTILN